MKYAHDKQNVVFILIFLLVSVVTQAQITENFEQPNVCSGKLPCWSVIPQGSGGNNRGGMYALDIGTSLCDTNLYDISTSSPITGSGSLHTSSQLNIDSAFADLLGDSYYLNSPTIATGGDSVFIRFRIDAASFHNTTSSIFISLNNGYLMSPTYSYVAADSGIVQTIGWAIPSGSSSGVVSVNVTYNIVPPVSGYDTLAFNLYFDDFFTTGTLDPDNTCNEMVVTPVTLVGFTASPKREQALLEWATASEQNNKGFEIQRSSDGNNWTRIGFVNSYSASGNSNERLSYSFSDNNPLPGTNYYRLRQVDIDGSYQYTPIRSLNFSAKNGIKLYPNPAQKQLYIQGLTGNNTISIANAVGQVLMKAVTNNSTQQAIDISRLRKGIYFVTVKAENGSISKFKIIKE